MRTRTRCDASLLEGSRCRFVATATIGTDHIDIPYCQSRGITVANAPGCNAPAVAQWVLSAIRETGGFKGRTLGVIGAGNVGDILIRWARSLSMKVLVNDPPLQDTAPERHVYSLLDEIAEKADIVTVHVPLSQSGAWPTYHLLNDSLIDTFRRCPLVLNASRGPMADTSALIRGLESGKISALGIDCWEGEPDIDLTLLEKSRFATPHIAGYSIEGKIRATQMVLDALSSHLGLETPLRADAPEIHSVPEIVEPGDIAYDILADTIGLKTSPTTFEDQRNHYNLRHEPGQSL
ncbi:MAG: 4-phosphoerythronate dehydrogenase [Muribaculaceae bacterium]|nr:4-phosphoerythronate dehydrogenase [Muribaculaceae bacterium]